MRLLTTIFYTSSQEPATDTIATPSANLIQIFLSLNILLDSTWGSIISKNWFYAHKRALLSISELRLANIQNPEVCCTLYHDATKLPMSQALLQTRVFEKLGRDNLVKSHHILSLM